MSTLPTDEERDEAGNQWFTLRGRTDKAVAIGGHIDSVPNGGWLDGSLNLLAGAEVLRRISEEGVPPLTVRLVNWADEEGARFGRSLFGSSAAAGSLVDQDQLRELTDANGEALPEVLARHGVDLARATEARRQLQDVAAYVELHIEQGPVLESLGVPLAVVVGTVGIERHRVRFTGQAAHAGPTPMEARHDALAGLARLVIGVREMALETGDGAVATIGSVSTLPGIATSVVETAECSLDLRHRDEASLAEMLHDARRMSKLIASEERLELDWQRIWSIEPVNFDERLIRLAEQAMKGLVSTIVRLPSGALHDAAEVARAGIPTVMLFVQSLRGLSHTRLEDTREEHLELSVRALDRLISLVLARYASD
jgi:hydantoinase/carbamoylase family amidase